MIKMLLVIVLTWICFVAGIQILCNLTVIKQIKLLKIIAYSLFCAILTLATLTTIVNIF